MNRLNHTSKWGLLLLLFFLHIETQAQLNVGEYFFDIDPGIGQGIPLPPGIVSSSTKYDSTTLSAALTVPGWMSPGVHTLYIRYGNYNNVNGYEWSHYEARKFTVNPPSGNSFTQAEYFFDQDPGVGNGISLPLIGNADSSDYSGSISTLGLQPGFHTLHIRVKHVTGKWSNYETRKVRIHVSDGTSIVQAEYFYDVDPGFGNATTIPLTGNTDSSFFTGNVSTNGLSYGIHQLCIRAKNASGEWSNYETRKVKILSSGNSLVQAEGFYDTDPGIGNGWPITMIHTGDSSSFSGYVPTNGLSAGNHILYIRAKGIEGNWSLYEQRKIQVKSVPTYAEYFFDTDPGVGNGNSLSLLDVGNGIAEFTGGAIVNTNLSYGNHMMYVRTLSSEGLWGNYDSLSIFINCKNPGLPAVTQTFSNQCGVEGVLLTATGQLNDAAYWNWYSGSCGGPLIGTGNTLFVTPDDTTTYYVQGEGGCTNTFICTPITVELSPKSHLNLKLFIEGYYMNNGVMQTALFNEGQPTCALVTDTITVELRDPVTHVWVASQSGILHTNGNVRCNFSPLTGDYYVVVKHRNSIETWSSVPVHLNSEMVNYDFTTQQNSAYGGNLTMVDLGTWALYSGDINQDQSIDAFDYLLIDPDIISGLFGYLITDINGDGGVDAFDYIILDANLTSGITGVYP